ncbi:MAG TPA: ATP-binding protein [Terriglobales bacterium]|jgi:hypothetical protein|nr:ATP-binding protein [Terriglobales bacterium]
MSTQALSLVSLLNEMAGVPCLAFSVHRGFRSFGLDLSRFLFFARMDNLRYIEFPPEDMTPEDASSALNELIEKFKWRSHIKIVLSPSDSENLVKRLRMLTDVVVILQSDLQRLTAGTNVTQPLRELLREQLDVKNLAAYQYQGAVTGNKFFGREAQLNTLIQHPGTSYLVTGTRMSGKTSLLQEAKRRIEESNAGSSDLHPIALYIDCKRYTTAAGFISAVLADLEERSSFSNYERWDSPHRWHSFFRYLRTYVRKLPNKHLYLFLDEYDQILQIEKEQAGITWNFRSLKDTNSPQKGVIQFVLAGSKGLAKQAANRDSGLYNFVDPEGCKLDNFDVRTIKQILQSPMEDLGFRIDDLALIAQDVLTETAGRPSSVQFICYNLVRSLVATKKSVITDADVKKIVRGPEYLQYYKRTVHENTDIVQKFVLCAQSQDNETRASFSQEETMQKLRSFHVYLEESDLIESLDDLVNSGFLVFDERAGAEVRFVLSTPVIKRIFRGISLESYIGPMVQKGLAIRLENGL